MKEQYRIALVVFAAVVVGALLISDDFSPSNPDSWIALLLVGAIGAGAWLGLYALFSLTRDVFMRR